MPTSFVSLAAPAPLRARFQGWQDRVREPALTVLLSLQLLFIFVVSPLVSSGPLILLSMAPLGWTLVAGANHYIGLLLRMGMMLAVTVAVVQAVFAAPRVTRYQLFGAVVVYLNLALLFMGAFSSIRFLVPHAFATLAQAPRRPGEMLYFSLTTLTSTGYGDILPVYPLARSLANPEAVVGQLFLAIFLARLVSLHGRAPRPLLSEIVGKYAPTAERGCPPGECRPGPRTRPGQPTFAFHNRRSAPFITPTSTHHTFFYSLPYAEPPATSDHRAGCCDSQPVHSL